MSRLTENILLLMLFCSLMVRLSIAGESKDSAVSDNSEKVRLKLLGSKDGPDRPSSIALSAPFVLNTINPDGSAPPAQPNGAKHPLFLVGEYQVTGKVKVRINVYRGETLMRRLLDEEKNAGTYQVYWDGTDDEGEKLSGEYTCLVTYLKNNDERKIKFNVTLERNK